MNLKEPFFQPLGERAILITWEEKIDENLLYFLLLIQKLITKKYTKERVEVINTYNSLLINYNDHIEDVYGEINSLKSLISNSDETEGVEKDHFIIPVCYEEQFGLDLHSLSEEKELAIAEIIDLHTKPDYTIYFLGFLPGFLYLGGLLKELHFPRKKTPRLSVKKGAVGIANKQTGIYPQNSAGGWQLIGNCPIPLFDASLDEPSPFAPGDKLSFRSVSLGEYEAIEEQLKKGTYQIQKENYGG